MTVISGHIIEYEEKAYRCSIAAACELFLREFNGYSIDFVNDKQVVGMCEVCGIPLLEGSKFYSDQEQIMWCKKHGI